MKGPFFVSQIVGILVKCVIPFFLRLLSADFLKLKAQRSKSGRCCTSVAGFVLRILNLIFFIDCDAVGGISYAWRGPPWVPPSDDGAEERPEDLVSFRVVQEGKRREFCVFDEYLEILLQCLWTTCFTMVSPYFVVLALFNNLLEQRTDTFKLTYVRRRPFPRSAFQALRWLRRSLAIQVVIGLTVNVLVLAYSYGLGALVFTSWRGDAVGANADQVTALAGVTWLLLAVVLFGLLPVVLRICIKPRSTDGGGGGDGREDVVLTPVTKYSTKVGDNPGDDVDE